MPLKGKASPQQRAWLERRWPKRTLEERFWSHVAKGPACWTWTGSFLSGGYGSFTLSKGVTKHAHRQAWELTYGPIPLGLHVLHACDVPPCVNPDHLWLGTHQENMADMVKKGRHKKARLTERD